MVGDGYGSEVTDATLRGEIELLADVITAAAEVDGRLTTAALDQVLGLANQEPRRSRGSNSDARAPSADEHADLVQLLRRGSWRPYGGLREE
jgi:hypothetical protein